MPTYIFQILRYIFEGVPVLCFPLFLINEKREAKSTGTVSYKEYMKIPDLLSTSDFLSFVVAVLAYFFSELSLEEPLVKRGASNAICLLSGFVIGGVLGKWYYKSRKRPFFAKYYPNELSKEEGYHPHYRGWVGNRIEFSYVNNILFPVVSVLFYFGVLISFLLSL